MALTPERLATLLDAGGWAELSKEILAHPPGPDPALAEVAWERYRELRGNRLYENRGIPLALAAFAEGEDLEAAGWPLDHGFHDLAPILLHARPPWLGDWAPVAVSRRTFFYRPIRTLIHEGLLAPPRNEAWVLGLIRCGLDDWHRPLEWFDRDTWLAEDLWRLFEVEGGGEDSLAAVDKYAPEGRQWKDVLLALVAAGRLDRARVLDASLAALDRGFQAFRAGWFSRLHEALEPSVEERAARQAAYRSLLASEVAPTASMALKALEAIHKGRSLDASPTLEALAPFLATARRGAAKRGLKLAGKLAKEDLSRACLAAAAALGNPDGEVQAAALAVLEKHGDSGDDALRAEVAAHEVEPSLRTRLGAWLGETREVAREVVEVEETDAVAAERPLAEVRDPAALERLLGEVLVDASDPMRAEAAFAGMSRFADQVAPRPAVLKRAEHALDKIPRDLMNAFDTVRYELARLARLWAGADYPPRMDRGPRWDLGIERARLPVELREVVEDRTDEIAARVREGRARPLLSAPTHAPGWVSPGVLVERLATLPAEEFAGARVDLALAFARLAPGGRPRALEEARRVRGELGKALRFALGGNEEIGEDPALWLAASHARAPGGPVPSLRRAFPDLGRGAGEVVTHEPEVRVHRSGEYTFREVWVRRSGEFRRVPATHLAILVQADAPGDRTWRRQWLAGRDLTQVRWSGTATPADLEWFFAEGVERIDLEWSSAQWEVAGFLEALLRPDLRPGPMGHLLGALGLAAKNAGQRELAARALAEGGLAGRVDGGEVGRWLAWGTRGELVLFSRLAKGLAEVRARGGGPPARDALRALVAGLGDTRPRGLANVLSLLLELSLDAGEGPGEAAAVLAEIADGKGKPATLARKLLAAEGGTS